MIQTIIEYCLRYCPDIEAIYLFGSQVSGHAGKDSDIDIAILCPTLLPANTRWELSQTLAIQLQCDVDLIDLKQASTVMQWQIIHTGQRIFSKDAVKSSFFETYVLSDYIYLSEQRKAILNDIKQRGSVYD